jgi:YesN/AraC family two-component response regulator
MIRVLLADDQALVRAGFRALLDAEPDIEVVGEANDGAEAARLAAATRPDVVLMDIRMPGVDGLEATPPRAARTTRTRSSPSRPMSSGSTGSARTRSRASTSRGP